MTTKQLKGFLYETESGWHIEHMVSNETPEGNEMSWKQHRILPSQQNILPMFFNPNGVADVLFELVTQTNGTTSVQFAVIDSFEFTEAIESRMVSWDDVHDRWNRHSSWFDGFWEYKKWIKQNYIALRPFRKSK